MSTPQVPPLKCVPLLLTDSSSSDEEDRELPFWNNWLPPSKKILSQTSSVGEEDTTKFVATPLAVPTISEFLKNSEPGKWIPPVKSLNASVRRKTRVIQERNAQRRTLESNVDRETEKGQSCEDQERHCEKKKTLTREIISCRKIDWGGRTQLHDVTKFKDGDLVWGVVNLGVFASIKLRINEYGNICAQADGTISKVGSTESTFISILNGELLRKMLGLSGAQWASLCETVLENKSTLMFDAFQDFRLTGAAALEKLWFFICKRRHFLPDQCMLVKLTGAVKCMRKFKITPKLVVQEIRIISEQQVV